MGQVKAKLILENGKIFSGYAFGHVEDITAEVVFNTAMTGYQETLTDPSYAGQFVVMTYPLIGNYGINLEDMESDKVHMKGFIVRENCEVPNNFRCEMTLDGFLKENKVVGLYGIDTRALTRTIREHGTMKGIITTLENISTKEIQQRFEMLDNTKLVSEVSRDKVKVYNGSKNHIAVIDYGIKQNILREFRKRGCKLTVFPYNATFDEIMSVNPDGVFLSNGPGDPTDIPECMEVVKKLTEVKPVVGICLGHQLICLAFGATIEKLKFGHHGANHPVKDVKNNRVYISSQNHNYCATTLPDCLETTFVNVNDGTIEGVKHKTLKVASVQFHPEASPGPRETNYIFDEFVNIINS